MEKIITNRGLDQIAVNIFSSLNSKELSKSMKVSPTWRDCINSNRIYWVKKLKKFRLRNAVFLHGAKSVLKNICLHFEKHENPAKIKRLLEFLNRHKGNFYIGERTLQKALLNAKFIWTAYPKGISEPIDKHRSSSAILYHAFMYGTPDIVNFYLDTLKENGADCYDVLIQLHESKDDSQKWIQLFQIQENKAPKNRIEILYKLKAPNDVELPVFDYEEIDKISKLFDKYIKGN